MYMYIRMYVWIYGYIYTYTYTYIYTPIYITLSSSGAALQTVALAMPSVAFRAAEMFAKRSSLSAAAAAAAVLACGGVVRVRTTPYIYIHTYRKEI